MFSIMVKPILKFSIFELETIFLGVFDDENDTRDIELLRVQYPWCHCFLSLFAAFEKITIRWLALSTFRATDPRKLNLLRSVN